MGRKSRRALIAFGVTAAAVLALRLSGPEPSPQARQHALALSSEVRRGEIDDCEALARFAAAAAERDSFRADFNVFIPRSKVNWPLGAPIGLTGVDDPVKLEGAVSGYRPRYRKGYGPGTPEGLSHDMAHHFAPYFLLGLAVPRSMAEKFLEVAERPERWGDLYLGRAAIAAGKLPPREVSDHIQTLCR